MEYNKFYDFLQAGGNTGWLEIGENDMIENVAANRKVVVHPSAILGAGSAVILCSVARFYQKLIYVVVLCFSLEIGAGTASAREMNCDVFDELATLVHLSELFLDNIESGANRKAPAQLTKFLKETPVVELRMRLNDNGLNSISGPTAKFIAQQKTLLKIRAIGGQFKAAEAVRKLRMRVKLEMYRSELVALPCLNDSGRSISGSFSDEEFLVSSKVASFGAITILVIGVAAFLVFDRINKINSRKKKRFICNASCLVQDIGVLEPQEANEAQIVDVSQIGAKIKSEVTSPVGAEVEVSVPEKTLVYPDHSVTYASWSIPARVLWRNGNYFGVEFKSLMAKENLDQLVGTG